MDRGFKSHDPNFSLREKMPFRERLKTAEPLFNRVIFSLECILIPVKNSAPRSFSPRQNSDLFFLPPPPPAPARRSFYLLRRALADELEWVEVAQIPYASCCVGGYSEKIVVAFRDGASRIASVFK